MADKDVRKQLADRALSRGLARRIARLERHLREVETASQAAFRSVEDGALDFYDDDGVLRERIGKQADGSWGRVVKEGPIPPAPTEPDVQVISDGVVAITWDGRTEEKWPFAEFRMVRVHLGETEDFTPDRDNQVGAIWAARGGTIVAVTESDDDNPVWVKLAAVSTAGHWTASDAVLVDEIDEDDLEEEQEELQWEDGDGHTLSAADVTAGSVTFGLSHIPEDEALLAWWHPGGLDFAGVPQTAGVDLTVDAEASSVTWPLSGFEQADDRLRVYYPYRMENGAADRLVDYESTGWRYLVVATSDSTDRSAVDFDDSGWSVGSAPFGDASVVGWPAPATSVATMNAIWLRRTIGDWREMGDVTVSVRRDNYVSLYWNGVLIGTTPTGTVEEYQFTIPRASVLASNTLAVRCEDSGPAGFGNHFYIDVRAEV